MSVTGRQALQTSQETSAGSCSLREPNLVAKVHEKDSEMLLWLRQETGKITEKRNMSGAVGDGTVSTPCRKILPSMKSCGLRLKKPYRIQILTITMTS
jgi:hypothetical protein